MKIMKPYCSETMDIDSISEIQMSVKEFLSLEKSFDKVKQIC